MWDLAFQPEFLGWNNRYVIIMKYGWNSSVAIDMSAADSPDLNVSCYRNSRGLRRRIPSFICGTHNFLMTYPIKFHAKHLPFADLTESWLHVILTVRRLQWPCRWVWHRLTKVTQQTRSRNKNPVVYSKDGMGITALRGKEWGLKLKCLWVKKRDC